MNQVKRYAFVTVSLVCAALTIPSAHSMGRSGAPSIPFAGKQPLDSGPERAETGHRQMVNSLQVEVDAIRKELADLRAKMASKAAPVAPE